MKIEMKVKDYQFGDERYDFNLVVQFNQDTGEAMTVQFLDNQSGKTVYETTLNEKATNQLSWIVDSLSEEAETANAWRISK